MYYLCSENKGADQLRSYREADLRLCFRICKKPVFSRRGSYFLHQNVCCNHPIIQTKRSFHDEICLKVVYGMANSVDPDQTPPRGSLIRVCTVCHTVCICSRHYS